eukprot:SAG11_NODE_13379_length_658_cov_0.611807_1_plen_104_part_10
MLKSKEQYRLELIRKIEEELAEQALLEDQDDGNSKNLFPINMDGVHVFKHMLTLRDWSVHDSCAEELPGRNVAFAVPHHADQAVPHVHSKHDQRGRVDELVAAG